MSFELGIPYDPATPVIPKGSTLKATVEYLVPPAFKNKYYGSNYLTALDEASFQSTDMAEVLATDNAYTVSTTVGTLLRTYPIQIQAEPYGTAAQFEMNGGLGYTPPVTFTDLARPDGWMLEHLQDGVWTRVDQSVEGNEVTIGKPITTRTRIATNSRLTYTIETFTSIAYAANRRSLHVINRKIRLMTS